MRELAGGGGEPVSSGTMLTLAFGAVLVGALLLTSGVRNRSLTELIAGVTEAQAQPPPESGSTGTSEVQEGGGAAAGASSGGGTGALKAWVQREAHRLGWSAPDWEQLITRESGWNSKATNPSSGASGIGQFLGATKAAYASRGATSSNPIRQLEAMRDYIQSRYGSSSGAWAHETTAGWY